MNSDNQNIIAQSMLTEIKSNQTAVIKSSKCEETMVAVNNSNKAYGIETFLTKEVNDTDQLIRLCKAAGFPNEFIFLSTDATGEVYINMECSDSLPIAICVKEINGELKLCKVLVKDYQKQNKDELSQ